MPPPFEPPERPRSSYLCPGLGKRLRLAYEVIAKHQEIMYARSERCQASDCNESLFLGIRNHTQEINFAENLEREQTHSDYKK
jgi:hypothetical protein